MSREPRFVEVASHNELVKRVEARLKEHAQHIERLNRTEVEVHLERQFQAQRELADKLQAQSASYANVVIGFGYAGFFVLWNMVDKAMPPWAHSAAGLLIGLSLTLFVGWEIFRMISTALQMRSVQKQLMDKHGVVTINSVVDAYQAHERNIYKPWALVLIPTLLLAAAGAGLVLWFLAIDLVRKGAWPS